MSVDTVVSLEMPPDIAFARVATAAAETLALCRGLARRESLRFQLTIEEFFACLVQIADGALPIRMVLTGKRHQVRVAFRFAATTLSLGALNATTGASVALDGPSQDLGLLLAAKAADRFHIEHEGQTQFVLEAEVDKTYPVAGDIAFTTTFRPPFTARPCADPAQLALAAALAAARYPAWHCPIAMQTPAKFADMVEAGDVCTVLAVDGAGQLAGLLCWRPCGARGLHFSGPFVFTPAAQAASVARLLTERFLEVVAREPRDIVFSQRATADVPPGYFESLGTLALCHQDGCRRQDVLFRHLQEDTGASVWCHPALEPFLRETYDRLAMFRDIQPVGEPATQDRGQSLLSATLDRQKNLVELAPLLDGPDMAENIANHVRVFHAKGIGNILFYMDLSRAWQAALAGELLQAGFMPGFVLPHAGHGDVLVFQYAPAA